MCASMVDIQSATAEIRRGQKKIDRKKERRKKQDKNIVACRIPQGGNEKEERKKQDKNIMSTSATQGGHKKFKSDTQSIDK